MEKKQKPTQWPTPWRTREGRLGEVAREYVKNTEEARGDGDAYARVLARAASSQSNQGFHLRPFRRLPTIAVGLAMTCVLVATALVVHGRVSPVSEPKSTVPSQSAVSHAPPSAQRAATKASLPAAQPSLGRPIPASKTASIRLQNMPSSLPAGKVDLDGQAMAVLSADAVASGRTHNEDTEIALSTGNLELHVLPRAPGHSFAVRAGLYQFTVIGTVFSVSQTLSRLELVVSEGKVAVSRGTRQLAMVGAGGKWAVEVNPSPAPTPAASPLALPALPPAPAASRRAALPQAASPLAMSALPPTPAASPLAPPTLAPAPAMPSYAGAVSPAPARAVTPSPTALSPPHCGQFSVSKRTQEALLCYQEQAAQSGLAGETAQYELARLLRDSLADPERALAAFKDQRSRFPNGALRTEADLSIIELLPRLGHHIEAMAETEQFLVAHPKAERRGEIHLLRGNILREVLHDLDRAEREYARGSESGGRIGDDSRFLRAVCLEALGRVADAKKAYETYMLETRAAHVEEAKRRLGRLRP